MKDPFTFARKKSLAAVCQSGRLRWRCVRTPSLVIVFIYFFPQIEVATDGCVSGSAGKDERKRMRMCGCANSHELLVVVTLLLGSSRPRMHAQQAQLIGGFLEKSCHLHDAATRMERGEMLAARGSAQTDATKTDTNCTRCGEESCQERGASGVCASH
ncbi:hypothetical protein Aduo_008825 [Ancylostoma duodenale]